MSDRELLELAAKAAEVHAGFINEYGGGKTFCWNPLTDDGDALRLAVKLGICIVFLEDSDSVGAEHSRHGVMIIEALDDFGTRRAITRAAAEIGRAMP